MVKELLDEVDFDLPEEVSCEDEQQEMFEHYRFDISAGQVPMRVDKYLSTHMEYTSRHRIQLAIKAEYIRVNDKIVKANYVVRPGDVVTFVMPYQRRGLEILPEDIPLNIVYEDDDLLVVNKDAGMVVHPGHGHFSGTLINALAHHLGISQGPDAEDERMGVLVHRIDKDTSGLLVVAKNDEAQLNLAKQFFVHSIERRYVAIVWGNLKEDEGTIIGNIGRDPNDRMRFKVFPDGDHGKHAGRAYGRTESRRVPAAFSGGGRVCDSERAHLCDLRNGSGNRRSPMGRRRTEQRRFRAFLHGNGPILHD